MNIVCEKAALNPQVFPIVVALADMEEKGEPSYKIDAFRQEHDKEIQTCRLFDRLQYGYIMGFYGQEESWKALGVLPVGVDEAAKTIELLVAADATETVRSSALDGPWWRARGGLVDNSGDAGQIRLKADAAANIMALLGEKVDGCDLHCYCVPIETVNSANDEFFGGFRLRESERRRQEAAAEEDPEFARAANVTLIDAKEDKDIDKIAVDRAMSWLRKAINYRATDIHIEPSNERDGRVRFRIDGDLQEIETRIPLVDMRRAISWLKVQARVDLNAGYRPLDGKIKLARTVRGERHEIDVRFSSIPTVWGDKVVLRLLDKNRKSNRRASEDLLRTFQYDLSKGRDSNGDRLYRMFTGAVEKTSGIILVTGPTGSGKTTTLNTSLQYLLELNGATKNITTIEDPVEYTVEGAAQIQTEPKAGLTFASALRSILRQDPDIVLVGEIRDAETAQIAVQAALTGHLILSTLHTNDAIGCVDRLQDLGVSPFLIGSTVRLFQAQRLVQLLCRGDGTTPGCAAPMSFDEMMKRVDDSALAVYRDVFQSRFEAGGHPKSRSETGCEACKNRGYSGRCAVAEMIEMNSDLSGAIQERAPRNELLAVARAKCGLRTMLEYGLDMFFDGVIDFANVRNLFTGA
ncbi:MAG: type II/IV secretion system protein [Kiritimatiellae bacterium]|nr:type II/IV secretion system protein [Kiritimatiellia bacterium]